MIQKNSITWNNDYKYDGYLYYIQRVTEMLNFDAKDLFRIRFINTTTLIDEYLDICNGYAKQYHLDEVYHEFIYTFNKDIIIQHKWGEKKKQQILELLKSEKNRKETMMYLQHALSNYMEWCKEYLSICVFQQRNDKKIERAIACFIPELFSYGYSKEGIYHRTKKLLNVETDFEKEFAVYLDMFDGRKKEYTVYFGLSDKLMEYQDILKNRLGISTEVDDLSKKLKLPTGFHVIKKERIKAVDVSVAADYGYKGVNLFASLYSFLGNQSEDLLFYKVLVASEDETIIVNPNRDKIYTIDLNDYSKLREFSVGILDGLILKAKCAINELNRIISYHNNAISNNGLENGFLNLWSILEFICVNDKKRSKIEQVKETIVPILELDFFNTLFEEISKDIKIVLDKPILEQYLNRITGYDDDFSKIVGLVLDSNCDSVFDTFIDEFVNYPLLRTRILHLHDNTKNYTDLYNLLSEYEKQVTWQIFRFYRIRNAIVHSGIEIDNIYEYGTLLHALLDQVTLEIIMKLSIGELCTINNALIDTKLEYDTFIEKLNDSKAIDHEAVELICTKPILWYK